MKCRVCGYELAEGRTYCPMCGTKVYTETKKESAAADMAWNTKDFPKPKKMEDIEMNWGNMDSFMKRDASEGFVTVEKTQPRTVLHAEPVPETNNFNWNAQPNSRANNFEIPTFMNQPRAPYQNPNLSYTQPQPAPAYTQPTPAYTQPTPAYTQPQQPTRPAYQPYNDNRFEAWTMPEQKEVDSRYWYEQNFTASGTMKTGPAVPLAKERSTTPVPPAAPVMPWQAKDVLQSAMPDATIQYVHVDKPRRVERPDYEQAYPDYASVPSQEQKRPEEFYTFTAKNEEFQKLLEQEYEKIKSINGNDYDSVPSEKMTDSFVPAESSVTAQDVSAFERSLFGEPEPAYPESQKQPEPKSEAAPAPDVFDDIFREKNTTSINLDELISDPLDPRFDIDTLEMTIKELKEEEVKEEVKRSERQQKLAAMEAAREAYFKSLDEGFDDEDDVKQKRFGRKKEEAKAEAKEVMPEPKETKDEAVSDATKIDLDVPEKTPGIKPEFAGLYDLDKLDESEEEEEPRSRHFFLKFLGIIVIIAAIFELAVIGFKYFMPDAEITAKAVEIETMVFLAVKDFCIKAWDKIAEVISSFKNS